MLGKRGCFYFAVLCQCPEGLQAKKISSKIRPFTEVWMSSFEQLGISMQPIPQHLFIPQPQDDNIGTSKVESWLKFLHTSDKFWDKIRKNEVVVDNDKNFESLKNEKLF